MPNSDEPYPHTEEMKRRLELAKLRRNPVDDEFDRAMASNLKFMQHVFVNFGRFWVIAAVLSVLLSLAAIAALISVTVYFLGR